LHKSSLKPDLTERHPLLFEKQNTEPSLAQGSTVAFQHAKGTKQMRTLVLIGVVFLIQFFWWFADSNHIGYAPLFWLLTFSLCYKMLRMLHEWYHYVDVLEPIAPVRASTAPKWTVDMLTTACPGEPYGMIVRTLESIVAVRYPHTTYLCDEGDDPFLRAECARLGVIHVTRIEKKNAKAGNINNALRQATGELCVVLDPDHEVTPDFLDQVLPYFEDTTVGYVQVVQAYGNQKESFVALGAAEQTYHFYGPLMMGMNSYNTVLGDTRLGSRRICTRP
jgi:cellulose synthase (UDP-forming)